MYKRQDWLHLQGQHGSGSSSSDDETDAGDTLQVYSFDQLN